MKTSTILYKTLTRALSITRPHDTPATMYFTNWLSERVPTKFKDKMWVDVAGNLHVDARLDGTHKTLFVAHVDTVHKSVAANKFTKTKHMWFADGAPLGADDGAGCAMLMHMLTHKVAGYYVFTQGEECGGIGATHLAKHYPQLLGEFDRAIAFDRRGVDSIITDQAYGMCCSDAFAQHLSDQLNAADDTFMYSPDPSGVYTDTAEFVDVIPECTNISVGYMFEHSDREQLDIAHFQALAKAVLKVKWDMLPTEREPGVYALPMSTGMYDTGWYKGEHWSDELDYTSEIRETIYDAQAGICVDLLHMIAESVYPEDPEMALPSLDRNRLTEKVLAQALQDLRVYDPDVVLCSLFDQIYRMH